MLNIVMCVVCTIVVYEPDIINSMTWGYSE